MTDALIIETGNGGDLVQQANDIATVNGYENAPYLSMFGGADWWGNYLIPDNPFDAQTETTLMTTALSSAGLIVITDAVKADLSFLDDIQGTTWSVSVTITGADSLMIAITINGQLFTYLWNPNTLFLTYIV